MDLLQAGTTFQNYSITRLIGRGGMGEVYEAIENPIGRKVALKVIANKEDAETQSAIQRFLNEAQALSKVTHPNVVTLFNMGQFENLHYIAMEFVEGISLRGLLNSYVLSAKEACTLAIQLLNGLGAFHQMNIVHRDVSPRNILVRPNGSIKIIDLGIAKQMGEKDITSTGMIVGTLSYMAPEIVYGLPATVRTDIWATGAILYEATSGQTLTKDQAALNSGEFPRECLGWVPVPFRKVVAKMCSAKPEDRYTSAAEAAQEFLKLANGNADVGLTTLAALARTIDNLAEMEQSLSQASVTGVTAKRALTIAAQMTTSNRALPTTGGNKDMTEVIKADTTLRIQASSLKEAIAQVRQAARPTVAPQVQPIFVPNAQIRKTNWAIPGIVFAIVAGGTFFHLKNKKAESIRQAKIAAEAAAKAARTAIKYSPTSPATIWIRPGDRPKLSWTPALTATANVEYSTEVNFRIFERTAAESSSAALPGTLTEGKYYWRLAGADFTSGAFETTIATLAAPEMLTPAAGEKLQFTDTQNKATVDFTWKCKPGAQIYRVQVSHNLSFTDVSNEGQTKTCDWKQITIPAGEFFWRVRIDSPAHAQVWSDPRPITVERGVVQKVAAQPEAPQASTRMLDNIGGGKTEPQVERRAPAAAAAPAPATPPPTPAPNTPANSTSFSKRDPVDITWSAVADAEGYSVEFSADKNFSVPIARRASSNGFQFRYKMLENSTVFWRVRAEVRGRGASGWSEVRSFDMN